MEEALKAYTTDAAYTEFAESLKGAIAPGKLADMVVLDKNLLAIPPESIPDARVLKTVVGGRIIYEKRD